MFISDLGIGSSMPSLATVRRASDRGLDIHPGTWSVCRPKAFAKTVEPRPNILRWGFARQGAGSPVLRVILGNMEDSSLGGIERQIDGR